MNNNEKEQNKPRFTIITQEEDMKTRFEQVKEEGRRVYNQAKEKIQEFNARDDVNATKEKVKDLTKKSIQGVSEGVDRILQNEQVAKVVDYVSDQVDQVRQDERVQTGVKKIKKTTMHYADKAYHGLKKVLEVDDEEEN